jgi:hypothetical protein
MVNTFGRMSSPWGYPNCSLSPLGERGVYSSLTMTIADADQVLLEIVKIGERFSKCNWKILADWTASNQRHDGNSAFKPAMKSLARAKPEDWECLVKFALSRGFTRYGFNGTAWSHIYPQRENVAPNETASILVIHISSIELLLLATKPAPNCDGGYCDPDYPLASNARYHLYASHARYHLFTSCRTVFSFFALCWGGRALSISECCLANSSICSSQCDKGSRRFSKAVCI